MNNPIITIIEDINKFESQTLEISIEDRLDKILFNYLSELNNSYNALMTKLDKKSLVKEISKW